MRRQNYFPSATSAYSEWFTNLADKIDSYSAPLSLVAAVVTELKADCRFCAYAAGPWITEQRAFGPAGTAALENLFSGSSSGAFALPGFVAPTLPAGVAPVAAGALDRIFRTVQLMKNAAGYTTAIGLDLGIEGAEAGPPPDLPSFTLKTLTGVGCECVRIDFKKYRRMGVVVEARRGAGSWEMLGIDTESPYLDERPLLVAGVPEVREYRLRFWDKGVATGDYTDVARATVGPV